MRFLFLHIILLFFVESCNYSNEKIPFRPNVKNADTLYKLFEPYSLYEYGTYNFISLKSAARNGCTFYKIEFVVDWSITPIVIHDSTTNAYILIGGDYGYCYDEIPIHKKDKYTIHIDDCDTLNGMLRVINEIDEINKVNQFLSEFVQFRYVERDSDSIILLKNEKDFIETFGEFMETFHLNDSTADLPLLDSCFRDFVNDLNDSSVTFRKDNYIFQFSIQRDSLENLGIRKKKFYPSNYENGAFDLE